MGFCRGDRRSFFSHGLDMASGAEEGEAGGRKADEGSLEGAGFKPAPSKGMAIIP